MFFYLWFVPDFISEYLVNFQSFNSRFSVTTCEETVLCNAYPNKCI